MSEQATDEAGAPEFDLWGEDDNRRETELVVDVDGFEGPLDLLLMLARAHKLDLTKISILALARQYLEFIDQAQRMKLEIAADYLVMAAWLAFLKSKLLLPKEDEGSPEATGEELAAQLAFRLQRLEAMRKASTDLMARKRLGLDVFSRGDPEPIQLTRESNYTATIYDLLKAYADQRQRRLVGRVSLPVRTVWSVKEARVRLERLLGTSCEWAPLDRFINAYMISDGDRRTAVASSFGAALEMAREGAVELNQSAAFGPLFVRRRIDPEGPTTDM